MVKVGGAVEAAFAESNKVDSKPMSLREMSEMVTLSVVPPEGIEPYEASIFCMKSDSFCSSIMVPAAKH